MEGRALRGGTPCEVGSAGEAGEGLRRARGCIVIAAWLGVVVTVRARVMARARARVGLWLGLGFGLGLGLGFGLG